jgi:RNA polymerase sigma factor (sigma-70 family)
VENASSHLCDFQLCHECLAGEKQAIAQLQRDFGPVTTSYLIGSGALPHEAHEVVTSLWADLLMPNGERPPRLQRYDGSCALQTWLNTVALNRLLTQKRTQQRWDRLIPVRVDAAGNGGGDGESNDLWPADPHRVEPRDSPLIEIMQSAVETAFLACEPEDFVLLQLKHCDGLHGTELAILFDCDESVISRRLNKAQNHIAAMTVWKVRQIDPWLELQWTDFVDLCRTATPACFGVD